MSQIQDIMLTSCSTAAAIATAYMFYQANQHPNEASMDKDDDRVKELEKMSQGIQVNVDEVKQKLQAEIDNLSGKQSIDYEYVK